MRMLVVAALVLTLGLIAGCGKEIGDRCIVSSDCGQAGDRQCDVSQKEGYCTIQGCDYSTCPGEAECIRFFTGSFDNRPCNPTTEDNHKSNATDDCSLDELCALTGHCAPRASEVRYCMRKCDKDSDCRNGYECRDLDRMRAHGGEPVQSPGTPIDSNSPKFCAAAPSAL